MSSSTPLPKDHPIHLITPSRWREIYWGADLPSIGALAQRFGVSCPTLRRRLVAAGVKIRTQPEQQSADFRTGRREVNWGVLAAGREKSPHAPKGIYPPQFRRRDVRRRQGLARRRRLVKPCVWCGNPLERPMSQATSRERSACSLSHAGSFVTHRRHHPDEPRPLVAEKLRALLADRPLTYDNARAVGERIGAEEPEILAVLA